mgnify:FL=1
MIYDIVIVGNGILGSTLALELSKLQKNLKIIIIGPKSKFGSASVASGAMLNVFAEIEQDFIDNQYLKKRFELGVSALNIWKKHHRYIENYSKKKIELKWGTYVLNSARGTKFEDRLFEYLNKIVNSKSYKKFNSAITNPDNIRGLSPQAPHRPIRAIKVYDGFINSVQLLNGIDEILTKKENITICDDVVKKINYKKNLREIVTEKNKFKCSQIVLANGAYAQKVVNKLPDLKNNTPKLFFGAGSAVILKNNNFRNKFENETETPPDLAIRTMDRGHACGLHLLPFKKHMYLGASSAVFSLPEPNPRSNQIAFMLNDAMNQIGPVVGRANFDSYSFGFRPVSEDIFPLIGETCLKDIWYLNGTKRDGLTMSPFICSELAKEILNGKSKLPKEFMPSRKLISYFNKRKAIEKTIIAKYNKENTHNMILPDSNDVNGHFNKLRISIEKIYKKYQLKNFGIHPELLSLYENNIINKSLIKKR